MKKPQEATPGDGIRSLKTSNVFRVVNFELYAKPNAVIMGLGLVAMAGSLAYIAYMRHKYEGMGYYSAVSETGEEQFLKKKSRWD
ncbi:small integral membrane protein 8 [Thrips palmi]|uniref:Small integral membrane protein 8 n=1 Tax=Thrips palmi TaxID=161013 RepID=A0A6P9ABG9_THRPL|nr:small integral membrane protein 8 [Thrips palmi]